MRKPFLFLCVSRSALHALAAAYAAAAPPPADDEIAVIVNKANDTGSLPRDRVRKIFMGDRGTRLNSKHRIEPAARSAGAGNRFALDLQGDADLNVPQGDPIFGNIGRLNGPSLGIRSDLAASAAFKPWFDYIGR